MDYSIIIPTYNRPAQLAACLKALEALDYPGAFEVIVVDDGSPVPPTYQGPLNVVLLTQPHAGPAAARNAGAAHARGKFLAFTDDDCAPAPDWLAKLAAEAGPYMVGGRTVNTLPDNPCSTTSQLLIDYLYQYYNAGPARFFTSNNFAMPAELFHKLGGFDTGLTRAAGEDRDLCDRWLRAGYGMTYVPAAIVHHAHALTLRKFWRQHFHYGQAAFYFHQKRAVKVEPFRFYWQLLWYPFTQTQGLRAMRLVILIGLSQVANAAGYFSKRIR